MTEPDLRVLALGAGVQSSTLYLLAARGDLTPRPDVAIFADTQDEPPWVYEHLAWLERSFGDVLPILRVSRGSLKAQFLAGLDGRTRSVSIPFYVATPTGSPTGFRRGRLPRHCTRDYKLSVIRAAMRRTLGPGRWIVHEWVGISTDEADRRKPSRFKRTKTFWPLLDELEMSRTDCEAWLREHGYPVPLKSACLYCPFHDDNTWAWLQREKPVQFAEAAEMDLAIRRGRRRGQKGPAYLHRSLRPLGEIDFQALATNDGRQAEFTFSEECEGMCGV